MRPLIACLTLVAAAGCGFVTESDLPAVGSVYTERETRTMYVVTWSGRSGYDMGACPDVGSLCVHLSSRPEGPLPTELAVTARELNARFSAESR